MSQQYNRFEHFTPCKLNLFSARCYSHGSAAFQQHDGKSHLYQFLQHS